jgi:hypothetical protein
LTAVIVVVAAVGAAAVATANRGTDAPPSADAATTTEEIAATWVDRQVSHGVVVACDPVMCATLRQRGFPGRKLQELRPSAPYPARAQVVVDTPDVEHQFGSNLAANVAPESLAVFGSGRQQISVRITAHGGAAAYRAQLAEDTRSRSKLARYLLENRRVTESPPARAQLVAGQVDVRLIVVLTALAADEPAIDIVSFGPLTPGESSNLPLRSVNLSVSTGIKPTRRAAFVRSLRAVVDNQAAPWQRSWDGLVSIAGRPFFQITFPAPSPLGLLPGGAP